MDVLRKVQRCCTACLAVHKNVVRRGSSPATVAAAATLRQLRRDCAAADAAAGTGCASALHAGALGASGRGCRKDASALVTTGAAFKPAERRAYTLWKL